MLQCGMYASVNKHDTKNPFVYAHSRFMTYLLIDFYYVLYFKINYLKNRERVDNRNKISDVRGGYEWVIRIFN